MPTYTKPHDEHSPLAILTELAVEGTSSLVEAQRALLNLAHEENEIIFNGVKERIAGFMPAVAMTDLVRRSLDTLIGMQQELLTTTSKQTLEWLQSEKSGTAKHASHLVSAAREGVETFTRAQKRFLEVVAQEAEKATTGKKEHESKTFKKTELAHLAREAGNAFIEAQKRLLDVLGQQMNVNLDATTRAMEIMSPARLVPVANRTGEGVRDFVNAETSLIGSLMKPKKVGARAKARRARAVRHHETVPA
ncbi:MAG TPA: hypothetical protein VMS18_26105 [Candidatus Binatia bacterium]|nr:hypothetical protein [Candidatus Binatia bacterium]